MAFHVGDITDDGRTDDEYVTDDDQHVIDLEWMVELYMGDS